MFSKSLMRPYLPPLSIVQLTARLFFFWFFFEKRKSVPTDAAGLWQVTSTLPRRTPLQQVDEKARGTGAGVPHTGVPGGEESTEGEQRKEAGEEKRREEQIPANP